MGIAVKEGMPLSYTQALEETDSIEELCQLVEQSVRNTLGVVNEEVSVHFAEMGRSANSFVGALYSPYFNSIVVNKTAVRQLAEHKPQLLKSYLFHVLLHEYIHGIGIFDEARTRYLTAAVCEKLFGPEHASTRMAAGEFNPFQRRVEHISVADVIAEELMRFFSFNQGLAF